MKALKAVLVVLGLLCVLTSAPAVFAPWSAVTAFLGLFGLQAPPDHPAVLYGLRVGSLAFALIGIFFLVLATDPLRYRPMLVLAVWGLFLTGGVALVTGRLTHMQPFWYLGDVVSCFLAAVLILAFWPKQAAPPASQ